MKKKKEEESIVMKNKKEYESIVKGIPLTIPKPNPKEGSIKIESIIHAGLIRICTFFIYINNRWLEMYCYGDKISIDYIEFDQETHPDEIVKLFYIKKKEQIINSNIKNMEELKEWTKSE